MTVVLPPSENPQTSDNQSRSLSRAFFRKDYNRFDFDDIDEALLIDEPADYIYSVANAALVDVTDTEFVGYADAFLGNSEGESDSYIFVSNSPSRIEDLKNFIESAREFDDAIRNHRIIHLEVQQDSNTKSGVSTENARQKAFENFRLEYSDDGGIAITADTATEKGLILRSFRDVEPAEIYDFLKKNWRVSDNHLKKILISFGRRSKRTILSPLKI